jgi:lipopolysaccharide export system protein LptA
MSDKNDRIEIDGDAQFIYGDSSVSGENITVFFDSKKGIKKITGDKTIIFEKVDLKGKSDSISWDIVKNEIIFSGNAYISRAKSGKTVGEIIRYFPKNDRIVISAKKRKRSKTTIK